MKHTSNFQNEFGLEKVVPCIRGNNLSFVRNG